MKIIICLSTIPIFYFPIYPLFSGSPLGFFVANKYGIGLRLCQEQTGIKLQAIYGT